MGNSELKRATEGKKAARRCQTSKIAIFESRQQDQSEMEAENGSASTRLACGGEQ